MARRRAEKSAKCECGCMCGMGHGKLFMGVVLFALGFAWWAAKMGLISEIMFWPNVMMLLGIIMVFKSVLMK
jgi:hypothetical protein